MGRLSVGACVVACCVLAALQPAHGAPYTQAEVRHSTTSDQAVRHRDWASPVPSPSSRQGSSEIRVYGIVDILDLKRRGWRAALAHPLEALLYPSAGQNSRRMEKRVLSLWATHRTSNPSIGEASQKSSKSTGPGGETPARPVGKQPLRWGR
ncbi:uncharacterized protein LOC122244024 [Penaeus japonicus]|uniref:uncharacterized protein LOC122244024 n=1 Tax=Penaeus japonicus TaxID=27405 RepID=UPI001C7179F3|nr:uncharacterized protein LOC122244024 [Penaeus japonicus]